MNDARAEVALDLGMDGSDSERMNRLIGAGRRGGPAPSSVNTLERSTRFLHEVASNPIHKELVTRAVPATPDGVSKDVLAL